MTLAQILEIKWLEFPSSFYFQSDYVTAQIGYVMKTHYIKVWTQSLVLGCFFPDKSLSFMQFSKLQLFSYHEQLYCRVGGRLAQRHPSSISSYSEKRRPSRLPLPPISICLCKSTNQLRKKTCYMMQPLTCSVIARCINRMRRNTLSLNNPACQRHNEKMPHSD